MTMPMPGDIFVVKAPDGRYTSVRVIQSVGTSSLVCTSPYLAPERPPLDHPLLCKTLTERRFFAHGNRARKWLDGAPPKCFELLGNIAPTKAERNLKTSVYQGLWDEACCNEAFLEWRWIHDRESFEDEVRKEREAREHRPLQFLNPKRMMNEQEFWSVISLLDWKHLENDWRLLAPAVKALSKKSKSAISRFEERLAFLLYQLDTKAFANNAGDDIYDPKTGYISPDGFLYARCAVVAKGSAFYKSVLNAPETMPKNMGCEVLLTLAGSAYKMKTGEEFKYSTGCSYESFSNASGWEPRSKEGKPARRKPLPRENKRRREEIKRGRESIDMR